MDATNSTMYDLQEFRNIQDWVIPYLSRTSLVQLLVLLKAN